MRNVLLERQFNTLLLIPLKTFPIQLITFEMSFPNSKTPFFACHVLAVLVDFQIGKGEVGCFFSAELTN